MSKQYEIEIDSIKSIYLNKITNEYNRKLKVYFSTPEDINEYTGIVVHINGFGGNSNANVYKKMRREFPDKYNLINIQCDYFGHEFMSDLNQEVYIPNENYLKQKSEIFSESDKAMIYDERGIIDFNKFMHVISKYDTEISYEMFMDEKISNFNDMGLMQALDNIIAVLSVMNILYTNNYEFNAKKIILFGYSQGAYISYLCNALVPGLFSLIIDNSSWIFPAYMKENTGRTLLSYIGKCRIKQGFNYSAKNFIKDKDILNLELLYRQFKNRCNIISYHGADDKLITIEDKEGFLRCVDNSILNEIDKGKVDNDIFKSTDHGLGADFLKIFDLAMNNLNFKFDKSTEFTLPQQVTYESEKNSYTFNYENILPIVEIISR